MSGSPLVFSSYSIMDFAQPPCTSHFVPVDTPQMTHLDQIDNAAVQVRVSIAEFIKELENESVDVTDETDEHGNNPCTIWEE